MRFESLSTQVLVEQGLGQRSVRLMSALVLLRRNGRDIHQHPGVGWPQVLCLQKDNLLRDTILEILREPCLYAGGDSSPIDVLKLEFQVGNRDV